MGNLDLMIQLLSFFFFFSVWGSGVLASSPSLFMMWLGLELSSLFFVPVLFYYSPVSGSTVTWKYYITQTVSSVMFLMNMIMEKNMMESTIYMSLLMMALLVKLSLFPFFGWSIQMCEGSNWFSLALLGSAQKIGPLIVLSKVSEDISSVFLWVLMVGMVLFSFFFFHSSSIRWMMMFSSIFNMGWCSMAACHSVSSLVFYSLTYFITSVIFLSFLGKEDSSFSSSFFNSSSNSMGNLILIMACFAMFGLPPMGTFLGKVDVSLGLVSDFPELTFMMVVLSSIISFFYMKISISKSFFSPKSKFEWFTPQSILSYFLVSWGVFLLVYFYSSIMMEIISIFQMENPKKGWVILMWIVLVSLIISMLLLMSSFFYQKNGFYSDLSGGDPFECGMDPIIGKKVPFYMHFFYIAILFLVFDVELALSIPLIYSSMSGKEIYLFWFLFFFILFIGLVAELSLGTLDWKE